MLSFICSLAYIAAPKAPINSLISGLITLWCNSLSKLLNTASFKNVPPWATIFWPNSFISLILITLYIAFLIIDWDKPAEISSTLAPSFWACLTEEFINTVHLEPKSTGCLLNKPSLAKSLIE